MFLLVRYVLIVGVSSLTIVSAHTALPLSQMALIGAALASNVLLGQIAPEQFFGWWVQGPVLLADTVWIALVLLSAGFGQQFFLFYFIELFLAAISESLALLAVGAVLIGIASIALGNDGSLSAATLIRIPFFFATAVFYGYVVDMAKQQRHVSLQRELWTNRLEQEVRARTCELERQGAEVRRLYDEVRVADRIKSDFVANMSHELRTPIHVILGYVDLALEDPHVPPDSELCRFLHHLQDRARALQRLVENVLAYANFERGQAAMTPRRFAMQAVMDDLGALCADLPLPAGVRVRLQAPPGLELTTDYDRLYSVLSNLLLNAVKFTPTGEVDVQARAAVSGIEISVHDTGIGISEDELPRIFDPFRQVDGSSTRPFGGIGLGLAIVLRNVKLLGGHLEVESELGKGSKFRVVVPRNLGGGRPSETGVAERAA